MSYEDASSLQQLLAGNCIDLYTTLQSVVQAPKLPNEAASQANKTTVKSCKSMEQKTFFIYPAFTCVLSLSLCSLGTL